MRLKRRAVLIDTTTRLNLGSMLSYLTLASRERTNTELFHSDELPRIVKFMETGSRVGWWLSGVGEGGIGSYFLIFGMMKKYSNPNVLNVTEFYTENGKNGNFMLHAFYRNFKT